MTQNDAIYLLNKKMQEPSATPQIVDDAISKVRQEIAGLEARTMDALENIKIMQLRATPVKTNMTPGA